MEISCREGITRRIIEAREGGSPTPMEGRLLALLDRCHPKAVRSCAKGFFANVSSSVVAIPRGDRHGQESGGRDSVSHCWPIVHPERVGRFFFSILAIFTPTVLILSRLIAFFNHI